MELENLKENKDKLPAQMAFYSAANAVTLSLSTQSVHDGQTNNGLNWPFLGEDRFDMIGDTVFAYAGFVRANPTAPAEALYRFASGRQHHAGDGTAWATADFTWRAAFTVFCKTLPIYDALVSAEIAALEADEFLKNPAPRLSALALPSEDTILERFGTILETSPNMALARLGSGTDEAAPVAEQPEGETLEAATGEAAPAAEQPEGETPEAATDDAAPAAEQPSA